MTATADGCASGTQTDRLEAAGQRAIAEALRIWSLDVYDPKRNDHSLQAERSRAAIDDMLRANDWTWEVPYQGDGQVQWCGIFAGACWRAAGLNPKWLRTYWASTYRLDLWARYRAFDTAHPNEKPPGAGRLLAELNPDSKTLPWTPRAGDILMIGDGTPACGDHITLVESYADGVFHTIEGNGMGYGPAGKNREGVVRAERHLGGSGYCARRLIRPAPGDLL